MRTAALAVAVLLALPGCTAGGGEHPPVGAAARARHGADPSVVPPDHAGEAEDPAAAGVPGPK